MRAKADLMGLCDNVGLDMVGEGVRGGLRLGVLARWVHLGGRATEPTFHHPDQKGT